MIHSFIENQKQTSKHVQNSSGEVAPTIAAYRQNLGRIDSTTCRIKNENKKNTLKQQYSLYKQWR